MLRDTDEVARLGGDELVVLLADVTDTASANEVAEKIRQAVSQPTTMHGNTKTITVSIGVALTESDIEARELLRNADHALYQTKHHGRDQTVVFSTQQTSWIAVAALSRPARLGA